MKKKLFGLFIILISLLMVLPAVAAPDLTEDHPFYDEINYLMDEGVLEADGDGAVRPDANVTRAEAAVMIGRLKDIDDSPKRTGFRDVPLRHYASGYIAAAVKAGYFKGYRDQTFRPNAPIKRKEMAVLLERVFGLSHTFNSTFRDVPAEAPYAGAISKLLAANILADPADNRFRPNQKVTRGEFAAYLARALEPEFKNDAVIENSYQKDKTKTYTYDMSDGTTAIHRFADVPDRDGLQFGFMWTVEVDGGSYEYFEFENQELFAFGYPYSEYVPALAYPVEIGSTFNVGMGDESILYTITAVNKTVETPYKTFTNATEVTTPDGFKYYMAEGYATIKSVNAEGVVDMVLVNVE